MTRVPAFARRYAAVRPVIPPPLTTTSASASPASFANYGNVVDVDEYGVVSFFAVAIVISFNVRRAKSPWHHGASTLFDRLPLPNGPRFQFDKDNVGNSRRDGAEVLQCSPHAALALDPDGQGFEGSQQ
jgi:hypothetical protein